jgi:hypothetical protein
MVAARPKGDLSMHVAARLGIAAGIGLAGGLSLGRPSGDGASAGSGAPLIALGGGMTALNARNAVQLGSSNAGRFALVGVLGGAALVGLGLASLAGAGRGADSPPRIPDLEHWAPGPFPSPQPGPSPTQVLAGTSAHMKAPVALRGGR